MGMFGRFGRALTSPGGDGLSLLDRAAIFATAAEGDPQTALALRQMPLQRAQQRQQQEFLAGLGSRLMGTPDTIQQNQVTNNDGADISAAFAPQMSVRRGQAPLDINSPDLPMIALQAQQLGVPLNSLFDVMKAQQPDVRYDRGFGYNGKSGAPMGGFHPDLGEGRGVTPDGQVATLPGYAQSVGEIEGAKSGAQERAKAQLDVISLNMPDGSTVQVPRDVAVQGLLQSMAGGGASGLGRSRSPEAQALATGRANNAVRQEGMVGDATVQAGLDLPKVRDQAQNTLNVLAKIRAHPSLADRTGNSTLLPALRPQDVDFDVMVRQIGGGAFLEAIQSLKGTGQITEIEGAKATDAIARMQNQRQSQAGFLAAMKDYEDIVRKGLARTERRAGAQPSATRWTPEQARAELARRRASRGQ